MLIYTKKFHTNKKSSIMILEVLYMDNQMQILNLINQKELLEYELNKLVYGAVENREKDKYAVIMKDGINIYEGIQERQDACIKVNVLNNTNIWVQFNSKSKKKIEKLIKTGLVNKYGIPLSYEEMSQEQWKVFTKIIKNEEGEKIE